MIDLNMKRGPFVGRETATEAKNRGAVLFNGEANSDAEGPAVVGQGGESSDGGKLHDAPGNLRREGLVVCREMMVGGRRRNV